MGKAISAQKSTVSVGSNATPPVWTQVKGVVSFTGLDGASSDIDTTDLDSDAKESMPGLQDFGTFNFNVNTNRTDPGQLALEAARAAAAVIPFQLKLPDGSIGTWVGYVKTTPLAGGVDAVLTGAVTTKISGAVAWTAPEGGA
jgi:hypothetical protein